MFFVNGEWSMVNGSTLLSDPRLPIYFSRLLNTHGHCPDLAGWEGIQIRTSQKTCQLQVSASTSFRVKSQDEISLPRARPFHFCIFHVAEGSFITLQTSANV
jgi:hypothetical protein